jgi:riboflavin kinase/FMN adenylyltransferase
VSASVLTVGTFAGVHRGHQAVAAEVVRRARGSGRRSVLVTFDPHPLEVVNPAAAPRLLTLPAERAALLAVLGLDQVAVLPFTPALSHLAPEAFVRQVLRAEFGMEELVLGYDHGFGRGRAGDLATMRQLGAADGFGVDVVEPVRDDGQPISSTLIRAAVAHGRQQAAVAGAYTVRGTVVAGADAAGASASRRSTPRRPTRGSCCRPTGGTRCGSRWREGGRRTGEGSGA